MINIGIPMWWRSGGGGGAWSPPSAGTLSLWVKATDGVYNDAGTTLATNSQTVQQWNDQSGNSRNVAQATAGNRPIYTSATPIVTFDGVDDYLRFSGSLADVVGSVLVAFKTGATAFSAAQVLVSSADEATANNWFEIGIGADGRIYIESNAAGTKQTVVGSSFLEVSTNYALAVTFDGTDYYASLNGVEQNPLTITNVGTFAWFGSVSGADNIVLGGTFTSGGIVRPFGGGVMEAEIYAGDIT